MPPTLMEEMLYKYAHPVHSVKSPYETCNAGLESLQTAELEKVPGVGGTRRALQALHSHRLPLAQRPVPTEHLQDSQQRRNHVQDPGLCLERNSVMAETTAFVLLGVKTSAVLARLRQNQV